MMNSATSSPFTFIEPSELNASVAAAHAPGRLERVLFGFAGLLSRMRNRKLRAPKPHRAQALYEALPPQQELPFPVQARPIPGRPVHRG